MMAGIRHIPRRSVETGLAPPFRDGSRIPARRYLRGLPFVPAMETADFRNRDDRSSGRCRGGSGIWRILLEPQMRPTSMGHAVIVAVLSPKFNSDECRRASGSLGVRSLRR
jgi:hypothetical protein